MQNHSDNAAGTTSAAGLRVSPVKKLSQESEAWFDYSSPSSASKDSAVVGRTKMNTSQNWYHHDSSPRDLHPIGVSQPRVKTIPCSEEKKARNAASGNPNDWFRHDHQGAPPSHPGNNAVPDVGVARKPAIGIGSGGSKRHSPVKTAPGANQTMWFAQNSGREQDTSSKSTRHSGQDAQSYYKRDKTGTGSDWFPHEHGSDTLQSSSSSSPRGTSRMNIESPAWFSHDNPPSATSPRPSASPEVRKMQAKASGDDVRQILRVDENLNKETVAATGRSAVDRCTESLIDQFQRQTVLTTCPVDK